MEIDAYFGMHMLQEINIDLSSNYLIFNLFSKSIIPNAKKL